MQNQKIGIWPFAALQSYYISDAELPFGRDEQQEPVWKEVNTGKEGKGMHGRGSGRANRTCVT